jgi:hypothetical protein
MRQFAEWTNLPRSFSGPASLCIRFHIDFNLSDYARLLLRQAHTLGAATFGPILAIVSCQTV